MYQRILVATDGSTLSKKAVTNAIQLAATCGAELVAMKVVPRYPQTYFEGSIPLSAAEIGRIEKQWSDAAADNLAAVQKAASAKGVSCKTVTVKSDVVSDAIIATAKKTKGGSGRDGLAWTQRHQAPAAGQRNPASADALPHPSPGAALSRSKNNYQIIIRMTWLSTRSFRCSFSHIYPGALHHCFVCGALP